MRTSERVRAYPVKQLEKELHIPQPDEKPMNENGILPRMILRAL